MRPQSRLTAGLPLILMPTVVFGGASIVSMLVGDPAYAENELRQDLWRAGHARADVLLVLSLVTLRYADEANLPDGLKTLARHAIPAVAGALAIGALAIGKLAVKKGKVGSLRIDEQEVGRLRVEELIVERRQERA